MCRWTPKVSLSESQSPTLYSAPELAFASFYVFSFVLWMLLITILITDSTLTVFSRRSGQIVAKHPLEPHGGQRQSLTVCAVEPSEDLYDWDKSKEDIPAISEPAAVHAFQKRDVAYYLSGLSAVKWKNSCWGRMCEAANCDVSTTVSMLELYVTGMDNHGNSVIIGALNEPSFVRVFGWMEGQQLSSVDVSESTAPEFGLTEQHTRKMSDGGVRARRALTKLGHELRTGLVQCVREQSATGTGSESLNETDHGRQCLQMKRVFHVRGLPVPGLIACISPRAGTVCGDK